MEYRIEFAFIGDILNILLIFKETLRKYPSSEYPVWWCHISKIKWRSSNTFKSWCKRREKIKWNRFPRFYPADHPRSSDLGTWGFVFPSIISQLYIDSRSISIFQVIFQISGKYKGLFFCRSEGISSWMMLTGLANILWPFPRPSRVGRRELRLCWLSSSSLSSFRKRLIYC